MVTFINSKRQIKKLPLQSDLETNDASLYKRLQYAKEILVQMIGKGQDLTQKGGNWDFASVISPECLTCPERGPANI